MDKDILNLVREWIRAEIDARIADAQPGSDGCYGTGYAENKAADAMFEKVCELLTPNAGDHAPRSGRVPKKG